RRLAGEIKRVHARRKSADTAIYVAKRSGKNCIVFAKLELNTA
ncbi:MAG: PleD family two-component response regulator, partial [Congregibacter sp.]